MGVQEPRIIDEINGTYDGRRVERIDRDNGKADFKVRKRATKRRHVMAPRTVKTDYWLDPQKDIVETETRDGEKRIYLVPVSDGLEVHREQTVHRQKLQELEASFNRDSQQMQDLERENRKLKRKLAEVTEGESEGGETSAAPQQRYRCLRCGDTMTEKQAERNDDRCVGCDSSDLEVL